jgi:segregation and condensation protein A
MLLPLPSMSFEIKLPLFQGPFDLLLFFIERDELDIYDIPISRITSEFLDYVHQLELINLEMASEFILVASTLMRIKSKMLLPRPQLNEEGKELDPREELVQHLLEYRKFKQVAQTLATLEAEQLQRFERGNVLAELKSIAKVASTDFDLQDLDLFRLLKAYQRAMQHFAAEQNKPRHTVVQYPYTIDGQKNWLGALISEKGRISFEVILKQSENKIVAIFNFLAVLEMLQSAVVGFVAGEGYNNFWLEPINPEGIGVMNN